MRFYEGPSKDGLYSPPSSYSRRACLPSPLSLCLTSLSAPCRSVSAARQSSVAHVSRACVYVLYVCTRGQKYRNNRRRDIIKPLMTTVVHAGPETVSEEGGGQGPVSGRPRDNYQIK